ncbi:MAG: PAS domain S-box protein [Candidatus Latescibacteria bacterium]|nr:PAS domain S-box protein [Candidatus Latescibacterota bacterium]
MDPSSNENDIPPEQIDAFADLFVLFNKTTKNLHRAYRTLEEKFDSLNQKLQETNLELRRSLAEKDRVSNYLNNILESLSSGVLVMDLEGRITLFNRAAGEIMEYPTVEALGRPYLEIMGKEVVWESTALCTLKTGAPIEYGEKEITAHKGTVLPLGYSTSLVTDGEGNLSGVVEIFNDLSHTKALEEEVQRVNTLAALGKMAATVAHEIRNPLGGIAGFASLLERDLDVGDPRIKLVKKIIEGVGSLNRIVTSLLEYTRPLRPRFREIDLVTVVDQTTRFFEVDVQHEDNGITILRNDSPDPVLCRADPEQLQQVLLNLLHNARQAMPEGGEIAVETGKNLLGPDGEEETVFVRVQDQGTGIPEDVKTKLFTPFYTTRENGTGLGLATAKKIIDAHHGAIHVRSQPGEGACFTIVLPHSENGD